MLALPFLPTPSDVHASVLNKLLGQADWARERLQPHAGKTVSFDVAGVGTQMTILATGQVQAANAAIVPDVTLRIARERLTELPSLLQQDPDRIADLLHVEGDAGLARAVSELARDLRWDAEQDLSRFVGDIAALRLVSLGKGAFSSLQRAGDHLAGNIQEYLVHETQTLVARSQFEQFSDAIEQMSRRLDGLESRFSAMGGVSRRRP